MSDNDTPLEKAVELLVYAPIGLAMFAKDTVPTFMKMFVARGQTEVLQRRKSAENHAGQYKTIGQMAVKYGGPEVRRQAEAAAGTVRKRAEDAVAGITAVTAPTDTGLPRPPVDTGSATPAATATRTATTKSGSGAKTGGARASSAKGPSATTARSVDPDQAALAIPDYDLLSATQVIDRLVGLARPDLLAVQAYETAHRARTTILGKITQLSA